MDQEEHDRVGRGGGEGVARRVPFPLAFSCNDIITSSRKWRLLLMCRASPSVEPDAPVGVEGSSFFVAVLDEREMR